MKLKCLSRKGHIILCFTVPKGSLSDATAILLTKKLKFSKHSAVIAVFGKEFIKTGLLPEKLHSYIIEAFNERQKGDYEVIFMQSLERALDIIQKADEFIKETEKFLKDSGYEL